MARMTKPIDQTLVVLKQIRDEITQTRKDLSARLDHVSERQLETNERLDRLERRQTASEIRLATELTAVVGAVHAVRDAVVGDLELRRTVDDHEQRLRAIEQRTG